MTTYVLFAADGAAQRLLRGAHLAPPGPGWVQVQVPLGTPVTAIRRLPDGTVTVDPDIPATQF